MRLIDADKLIEEFVNSKGGSKSLLDSILLTGITAVIENQRTIEPVIHAHWYFLRYGAEPLIGNWHCSRCNMLALSKSNYCPYCGAHMDEEVDDD